MAAAHSQRKFGMAGTAIGLFALGIALLHILFGPIEPGPALEEVVADTALRLKDVIEARTLGREYTPPPAQNSFGLDEAVRAGVTALGFIAFAIGIFGFVQKEEWRPSGTAIALGGASMAIYFVLAIAGGIILAILVVGALGYLGAS